LRRFDATTFIIPFSYYSLMKRKVILIVRDGWGYSEEEGGNAVLQAETPNHDRYMRDYPNTLLKAHGGAVGEPAGVQGGSEAGHLTMGAGRVVSQPFVRINKAIKDKSFYSNTSLKSAMQHCKENDSKLHLMGLFSDQGVHGTVAHLYSLLEMAKKNNVREVFVHCFLDGRDAPEQSASKYIRAFREKAKKIGVGRIASLVGRYYAMDRDTNYDRTRAAYDLLVSGKGKKEVDALDAMARVYATGAESDYYIKPIVIVEDEKPVATIEDNDAVIFWNFRSDRARQITYALTDSAEAFKKRKSWHNRFSRKKIGSLCFVCMSRYDKELALPVAFPPLKVEKTLGEILSKNGLKQLRIAETEKYAHVTYFFNGQVETPFEGEERVMVPSPKVPSYAEKPEMSAYEITEKLLGEIGQGYDFILVNYANGDLVGHSASMEAGIKACEVVDECVGKVVDRGLDNGYVVLVTADHGNIETMFYPDGTPCPAHGTNDVPFTLLSNESGLQSVKLKEGRGLSDIAPTVLKLMGLKKPREMGGKSLF